MMHGFTKENWKLSIARHPSEDAFGFDENRRIIAVADGVTRDPFRYLPKTGGLLGLFGRIKFIANYPKPSPAQMAAQAFCSNFLSFIANSRGRNEPAIRNAVVKANERIKELNLQLGISQETVDYLKKDYAGCVAAGCFIEEDNLTYSYICDSGIALFRDGNFVFKTPDEGPSTISARVWQIIKKKFGDDGTWDNPIGRKEFRKNHRNNPNGVSYGVFTGEEEAMSYVKTGILERKPGDIVFVYTDGLAGIFDSAEGIDFIRKKDFRGLEKLCAKGVKTEGTLVFESD